MEQRVLTIEVREKAGKGVCRRIRKNGRIPAVVYGKGIESTPVSIDQKEFLSAISGEGGINHLLTLKGTALDGKFVIVADFTRDSIKGAPIHVDLHRVTLDEKVKVKVPVSIQGTAKGVKEGGMLDVVLHAIEVECLPTQIPEHITVDVTSLDIGNALHISDLRDMPGIKVLDDPSLPIVSIHGKSGAAEALEEAAE